MRKALVTGNAGFVGRHFDRYLTAHGWEVTGADLVNDIDARELFRCEATPGYFDLVIHCAAVVGGRKTIDGAPLALASNLELDAGLFQWALRSRPRRVVYFSSSAAYPIDLQGYHGNKTGYRLKEIDLDETLGEGSTGTPDQLYGWAKLTGENLAYRYRQEGGKVSVVRPFSGYGEDQDAVYPFPAFIDRALRREHPFQVWGNGQQVRDFIHIDDIVGATMKMVEEDIDGPVNLGWGRPTSMRELVELVCSVVKHTCLIKYLDSEPSGVSYRVADPSKMLEFYHPTIDLEEGIERALTYRGEYGPHV